MSISIFCIQHRLCRCLHNERGVALILTMSMLVILTLLGVMVIDTTNTELGITTNYRVASSAFINAEMAMEYAAQKAVSDRQNIADLSTETVLVDTLPDLITLESRNEIIAYTDTMPTEMMKGTSTDAYQSNIYTTSTDDGIGDDAPYYRVAVQVRANNRSTARLEKLFVNRAGQVF